MKCFYRILWTSLTFLTALFILTNSLANAKTAIKVSFGVADAIEEQVNNVTDEKVKFTYEQKVMVSKIGHFLEYVAFSLFFSLAVFSFGGRPDSRMFSILFCTVFLALADEQLQLLSEGRGSRVSDVMIDLAGGFVGYGAALISCRLWERRNKK